jgi:hypothetical protein
MSDNKSVQRFFGYVLMAVGGLITMLCGGCTALVLFAAIQLYFTPHASYETWGPPLGVAALIVGGIPTAVGIVLFVLGRRMAKAAGWPTMSDNDPVDTFSAYGLMAFGGLIAVLCGGCTAVVLWGSIHSTPSYGARDVVFFAPIIGGVPTAVGIWAFLNGRGMLRRAKAQPDRDIDSPSA